MSDQILIAYDPVLRRPGCVLLQAVMGGDASACRDLDLFGGADNWIIHPTPDMRLLSGTREEWVSEAKAPR